MNGLLRYGSRLAVLAWLAFPTGLLAAPKGNEALPIARGSRAIGVSEGVGGAVLRLGLGLGVVLLVISIVWYVLKRARRGRFPEQDARGNALIDVVATTALGPNRSLHLVRVGTEVVVVGATEHSVTPIAHLTGDQAELLALDLGAQDARGAFAPSAGSGRLDARSRALATAEAGTVLERLRALTTRR